MNREKLLELEKNEDEIVRGIASLASLWGVSFEEAEKQIDNIKEQLRGDTYGKR